MSGPIASRLRSARRWFLLGSGPLKRTSDRVQVTGRVLVLLSLLAAVPLALLAAGFTRSRMEVTAAAQAADRHEVQAVVLGHPGGAPSSAGRHPSVSLAPARIGWRSSGGGGGNATVLLPAGTSAGATLSVWVDRRGRLTTAPMDRPTISNDSLVAGVATTVGVPLVVWGAYCGLCQLLDLQRQRRWGRDWTRVERQWRARSG